MATSFMYGPVVDSTYIGGGVYYNKVRRFNAPVTVIQEYNSTQAGPWQRSPSVSGTTAYLHHALDASDPNLDVPGVIEREEDVTDSLDPALNDEQLIICVPWLDQTLAPTDRASMMVGPMMNVGMLATVNLNDPPHLGVGLPRPSLWTGNTGVTVDVGDNDHCTVAAATANPVLTRTLISRWSLRAARLNAHPPEPTYWYPGWLTTLIDNHFYGDDPSWTALVPGEDVTCINHKYVYLTLTAPADGPATFALHASRAVVTDTACTCYFDDDGEPGRVITVEETPFTLTYTLALKSGAHVYEIDLFCNAEHIFPVNDYRLHHLTGYTLTLPPGVSGEYHIASFVSGQDQGTATRAAAPYVISKVKRSWDWPDADWNGFELIVDGAPSCQLAQDLGWGHYRASQGLLYIEHITHCPTYTGDDTELDSLYTVHDWQNLLGLQQGVDIGAGYPYLEETTHNKDANGDYLAETLYPFDLDLDHIVGSSIPGAYPFGGCVKVGSYQTLPGVPEEVFYNHASRGAIHGVAMQSDWLDRKRSTGPVIVWASHEGGAYNQLPGVTTDAQGRYTVEGLYERHYVYKIGAVEGLQAVTREWLWQEGFIVTPGGWIHHRANALGQIFQAVCWASGLCQVRRIDGPHVPATDWVTVTASGTSHPQITPMPNGSILLSVQTSGGPQWYLSVDGNQTWLALT